MFRKFYKSLIIIISLLLISCDFSTPSIFVTSYPMEYVAMRLIPENITIHNLSLGVIASRSTLNMTAFHQMKASDVVFRTGQLEPYLDLYRTQIETKGVQIIDLAANTLTTTERTSIFEQYGTQLGIDEETLDVFDSIDHYRQDSYLWMDPMVMISMSKTMKETMVSLYPDSATEIEDNYNKLHKDLTALDASYQILNNQYDTLKMASMTPSFNSWENLYPLEIYPVVLSRFGSLPNSQQLELMKEVLVNQEVYYFILEPHLPNDMLELAQEIVSQLSLTHIPMHDLFALTDAQRDAEQDYLSLMNENLQNLLILVENNQ